MKKFAFIFLTLIGISLAIVSFLPDREPEITGYFKAEQDNCQDAYNEGFKWGYSAAQMYHNAEIIYVIDSLYLHGSITVPKKAFSVVVTNCTFLMKYNEMDYCIDQSDYEFILNQYKFYE